MYYIVMKSFKIILIFFFVLVSIYADEEKVELNGYDSVNSNSINNIKNNKTNFTDKEFEYLKKKEFLSICVDPNWMPIEAVIESKHVGISADYWELIEKKLGVEIKKYNTKSWNGSIEAMKQKKCDVLSLSSKTPSREITISFTDIFLELDFVVVTKTDKKSVIDFSMLDGASIAIVNGYALVEVVKNKYPKIDVIEVSDIEDGLSKVSNGEVFGFADSAVTIDYAYENGNYDDLKVSAHFDEKLKLGLGVDKNNKILYNILQKVVKSITDKQKKDILNKWFSSKYEKGFDYTLSLLSALFISLLFIIIAYRYYSIRELNKKLNKRVREELEKSYDKDKTSFHQSKLTAMGEMMENIAHQWRQPLSQVNSCVLVIDDILDEKGIKNDTIEEKMHEIESLTKYMSNTIDDFKNFFKQDKTRTNTIVEDVIKNSTEVLKGKIEENKIDVIVDYRTAHECFTHPNELQQVFLAILNNAIDMLVLKEVVTPNIKIEIERDKKNISIRISDNAGGINEDTLDKIFEPYYTTKHKAQGTGLGLYISKVIVENSLGGELSVKNNFSGACFNVILKLRSGDNKR